MRCLSGALASGVGEIAVELVALLLLRLNAGR